MRQSTGVLLTSTALAGSLGYIAGVALNPFLSAIARDLGTTVPLMGQIPAISLALSAGLGLAAGPFADYFGHRRLLLIGMSSLVVNLVATGLAGSYATLVFATAIGAISQAILLPVAVAIIADNIAPEQQRRAISIVLAATSGTQIIGLPLLTTVAALRGWRAAFFVLALMALVVTLFELRVIPPDRISHRTRVRLVDAIAAYNPMVRHGPTLGLIVASGARGIGASLVFTYLGAFLVERHGLSIQDVGWVYTATGVGFLAGSLAMAGPLGRLPLRLVQCCCLALSALALGIPLLAPLDAVGITAGITFGFALLGIINAASTTELARETPAGQATTMSGNQASNVAGWAIGGSVGGLFLALGGYSALGVSVVVAGLFASIVVWTSRPRYPSTIVHPR